MAISNICLSSFELTLLELDCVDVKINPRRNVNTVMHESYEEELCKYLTI